MRHLRNERGIALVMVLVLSVIALAIMAGLLYMLTSGTQVSGLQKRYNTALEASYGGADVAYRYIGMRGTELPPVPNADFTLNATSACLIDKLNKSTANWGGSCDKTTPVSSSSNDFQFTLGTSPTYTVYAKIVDTVEGNTGTDDQLTGTGVIDPNKPMVKIEPYLYTIEVDTENAANPSERGKLSILYQH